MSEEERKEIEKEIKRLRYIANYERNIKQPDSAEEHEKYVRWFKKLLEVDSKLSRLVEISNEEELE